MIRKLDEPLTEYVEQAAIKISPAEIAELLPTLENAHKTKERIKQAVAAVEENGRRFLQHIEQLKATLDAVPDEAEGNDTSAA